MGRKRASETATETGAATGPEIPTATTSTTDNGTTATAAPNTPAANGAGRAKGKRESFYLVCETGENGAPESILANQRTMRRAERYCEDNRLLLNRMRVDLVILRVKPVKVIRNND